METVGVFKIGHLMMAERWDGFQWQKRGNSANDPATMTQTKKMRRVQLSNLPLYLGLIEDSIIKVVTDYLLRNYLNDANNQNPIVGCELNRKERTCVVELSSVEEANRFSKIKDITILNVTCKVTRLGESMYGTTTNMATILQNANVGYYDIRLWLKLKQQHFKQSTFCPAMARSI